MLNKGKTMKKETKDNTEETKNNAANIAACVKLGLKAVSGICALDIRLRDIAEEMNKIIKGSPLIWRQVKTGIQIARGWDNMSDAEKAKFNNKLDYFRKTHLRIKARKCNRAKVVPPAGNAPDAGSGKDSNPAKVVIPETGKTQKARLQVIKQVINALKLRFGCSANELQELLATAFAEIEDSPVAKVA